MEIVKYGLGFVGFIGIMCVVLGPMVCEIWEDRKK